MVWRGGITLVLWLGKHVAWLLLSLSRCAGFDLVLAVSRGGFCGGWRQRRTDQMFQCCCALPGWGPMVSGVGQGGPASRSRWSSGVHLWITTLTGLVALGISLYNFAVLQGTPKVDVALPRLVTIEPRAPGNAVHFFLQPTLSIRRKTESVEVITDAQLRLLPADATAPRPEFFWLDSGNFVYDFEANNDHWEKSSNPTPVLVSQERPSLSTFNFNANKWNFRAGRYEGSLILRRSGDAPMKARFCLFVSAEDVKTFKESAERDTFVFRNDVLGASVSARNSGCYVSVQ